MIELNFLICLQAISNKIHLKSIFIWATSQVIGTSDPRSELPISVGSSRVLTIGGSRPNEICHVGTSDGIGSPNLPPIRGSRENPSSLIGTLGTNFVSLACSYIVLVGLRLNLSRSTPSSCSSARDLLQGCLQHLGELLTQIGSSIS